MDNHVPEPVPIKKKKKMPKNKPKHGRNARLGGNKKYNREAAATARTTPSAAAATTAHVHAPTTQPAIAMRKRPIPAKEARKAAGYAKRSLRLSERKRANLQQQLTVANDTHTSEMAKERAKSSLKSKECTTLATLTQNNRKDANECRPQAEVDVARMEEEKRLAHQVADAMKQMQPLQYVRSVHINSTGSRENNPS